MSKMMSKRPREEECDVNERPSKVCRLAPILQTNFSSLPLELRQSIYREYLADLINSFDGHTLTPVLRATVMALRPRHRASYPAGHDEATATHIQLNEYYCGLRALHEISAEHSSSGPGELMWVMRSIMDQLRTEIRECDQELDAMMAPEIGQWMFKHKGGWDCEATSWHAFDILWIHNHRAGMSQTVAYLEAQKQYWCFLKAQRRWSQCRQFLEVSGELEDAVTFPDAPETECFLEGAYDLPTPVSWCYKAKNSEGETYSLCLT